MANYDLVINSKFQPFSFERYILPYQIYGLAYKEIENSLGELDTKASIWENMANEQTDPVAYKLYKDYANELRNKRDLLYKEGLNTSSRRGLLDMRARYALEITPIELAYATRKELAKTQELALLQDPTLLLSRRAATTSLDDYLKNPLLAYDTYSGKMLTALAATAAGALAKLIKDNPRKWRSILGGSYYETLMLRGLRIDDVLLAILGNENAAPELLKIVEDTMGSSKIKNWKELYDKYGNLTKEGLNIINSAYDYIRLGLWSAVGETLYQTLLNPDHLNPLQQAELESKRLQNYKLRLELLKELLFKPVEVLGNPYDLNVRINPSKSITTYNSFRHFFDKYGNLTKEGWNEYNRKDKTWKSADGAGSYLVERDSPFKVYMDSFNGGKPITTQKGYGPWAAKRFGELYRKLGAKLSKTELNADTYRNTAFDVLFKSLDIVKQALTSGKLSGSKLPIEKYTKDGYRHDGYINLRDSKFSNATFAGEYGIQGNYIVITDNDGEQYRVPLREVNKSLNNAITTTLTQIPSLYYKNKNTKYTDEELNTPFYDNKGLITTMQNEINKLINSARDNFGASFELVLTEPYKVEGGLH